MAHSPTRFFLGISLGALALIGSLPALGFATGEPLSLSIDPATVRQKGDQETVKIIATVQLKEPSPAYFVCSMRSSEATKVAFPSIIFRKGDAKGMSEGMVYWKEVRREVRVRISAYNADAPDRKLTFTVTLVPVRSDATGETDL